MKKMKIGILGATGMVGQRFVCLLENHPWFEVVVLAASPQAAGKIYTRALENGWKISEPIPAYARNIRVKDVTSDLKNYINEVDLVFSAFEMEKGKIRGIEESLAKQGIAVVSCNSAHRWTEDVPMIIPEINPGHLSLIDIQRKKRGWKGLIVVKPNCSLQSYLPVIFALKKFKPLKVAVTTLQAISGAGKTFSLWPEMVDNVIPFINGEEEKTEKEPLKIMGVIKNNRLELAKLPVISATCIRVPVSDGHLTSVFVKFETKPSLKQILSKINGFKNPLAGLNLPSAPRQFIHYFNEEDRPQTRLDRNYEKGMGITCGRFREDAIFDWKFVVLSHNTIRGAAGGAVLTAELLKAKCYL